MYIYIYVYVYICYICIYINTSIFDLIQISGGGSIQSRRPNPSPNAPPIGQFENCMSLIGYIMSILCELSVE